MTPKFSTGAPRYRSTVLPEARPAHCAVAPRDSVRASTTPTGLATDTYNFASPPPAVNNDGMGNYFGALRVSNDRSAIPYAMVHLRPQILRLLNGLNRKMLAAVGRYLVDNGGVASYAVSLIANYSVPVTPHSLCADKSVAQQYEEFFHNWCKVADFTRRFDFHELQRIACVAIDTDGDIGATMSMKSGFPQLRFFDTFHIGKLTGLDPMDGVVASDKDGGVLQGYNVVEGAIDTLESQAVTFMPVEQLLLLRDPARYDNYRGYSPIRRGSNDLRDQEDIKAFTKLKEKISAALAAVIQQNGMVEEDLWGNDSGDKGTNAVTGSDPKAQPNDKKLSLAELLGGDIPIIEGEIKQLEHKAHGVDAIEFLNYLAGQFVAGLDVPPSFFLDEKLTGPNIRAVIGKAQRKFDQRKKVIARLVEFCWLRVIAFGIATKQLPAVQGWEKISYQFPPLLSIDLGDVMANERADVMVGQMSEKERFGNRGKNSLAEHKQIVSEIDQKLEDAMKIQQKYKDVPLQLILTRLGFAATVSTTVPPEDSKTQNTEQK
jgi:Phage portal protein, lambda family